MLLYVCSNARLQPSKTVALPGLKLARRFSVGAPPPMNQTVPAAGRRRMRHLSASSRFDQNWLLAASLIKPGDGMLLINLNRAERQDSKSSPTLRNGTLKWLSSPGLPWLSYGSYGHLGSICSCRLANRASKHTGSSRNQGQISMQSIQEREGVALSRQFTTLPEAFRASQGTHQAPIRPVAAAPAPASPVKCHCQ